MAIFNGEIEQCLEVSINGLDHEHCLQMTNAFKKQCDAWYFQVRYTEHKSARKGEIPSRGLMIYQTAYPDDIIVFRAAIESICNYFKIHFDSVSFSVRSIVPKNYRKDLLQ